MSKKTFYVYIILIFSICILKAQQMNQVTNDITLEVLTESFEISKEPQNIVLKIFCNSTEDIQTLTLKFANLKATWSLISANLNEESLWLIKSDTQLNQNKVLAWNNDFSRANVFLYPFSWEVPYVLELELQINLNDMSDNKDYSSEIINLEAIMQDELYECSTSGRGNRVTVR